MYLILRHPAAAKRNDSSAFFMPFCTFNAAALQEVSPPISESFR